MTKYNIIYSDPPYKFRNWNRKVHGAAAAQYACMHDDEIVGLGTQISQITDNNCALFLWMPSIKIAEGLHVKIFESWGFRPISIAFVWDKTYKSGKPQNGIGFWTRNNKEFCLLGMKGKMKRQSTRVLQSIQSPITKHSEKPPVVRDKIIQLLGKDLNKIELFARQSVNGWDAIGLEITKNDIRVDLENIINGKFHLEPKIPIIKDKTLEIAQSIGGLNV